MRAFACTVLLTTAAHAQALPEAVSLDQALQLLDATSPRTRAERAQIDVVAADRVTAATWPNPSVSYGGQQLAGGTNTGSATQHQFGLEQPLLLFGQGGLRGEVASSNLAAERARVAAALAERRLAVRQAFAALLARQRQVAILEESLTDLARAQAVVKARAAAGDRSAYDVARMEAETASLDVEVLNARADREDAAGHLAAVLGFAGWRPTATGTLDPVALPTDPAQLWETAQRQRPALVLGRARQAAAKAGLSMARRDGFPVPAIALGGVVTQNAGSAAVTWGLSVPLPVLDRNQGPIARASAEVEAQALGLEAEGDEAHAEIDRAARVLVMRREALGKLEREVTLRLPQLRRMAEDAYREGRTGILELLDAFRAMKELQVRHLLQLESAKLAEVGVIAAAGLDAGGPAT